MRLTLPVLLTFFLLLPGTASAFNGHRAKQGPLTLDIGDIDLIEICDHPYDVRVSVTHSGNAPLDVQLRVAGLIDPWYAQGRQTQVIRLSPGESRELLFRVAVARGAYSALYPVHLVADFDYEGRANTARAVRIMETRLPAMASDTRTSRIIHVPTQGAVDLTQVNAQRVIWQVFGRDRQYQPVGWIGSADPSRASFAIRLVTRDTTRRSLDMHPAWSGGAGTIFAEYQVQLPSEKPICLSFANAIRDHRAEEPASDGVSFRVWINDQKVYERFTDSKIWVQGHVDLSQYAGQNITLMLESHPGPDQDTTCDSSYWARPVITAGTRPAPASPSDKHEQRTLALSCLGSAESARTRAYVFHLDSGLKVSVVPGASGLLDGVFAFGQQDTCVLFDGLKIAVEEHPLGTSDSLAVVRAVQTELLPRVNGVRVIHRVTQGKEAYDLTVDLIPDQSGLRARVTCPKHITDMAPGPFNQQAERVYWGHGYVVQNPKAFSVNYGGHSLSTSHVGMDFIQGLSLLCASDNPPDSFQVVPQQGLYALHTHMNATLTFVPSMQGAFDCATLYHRLYDKTASPGFANKAGRFVFDIWGGRYADNAHTMQKMIDYGLTDSLMTLHVWQRWGYDYRLPDIYPPDPKLGSLEDMNRMGEVCNPHKIPWGLHDNYIDFYPDANGYSYDHICFTQFGEPIKAWINTGRDAQSYRWRPDRILPFVKRNLKLIKTHIKPTHYFIDVFSSIDMFDFYDREGQFHSFLETRQHWGDTFRWIQDELGGAVTTSEAGDDQLTGWLDGADCQHLVLSDVPKEFNTTLQCEDWERTPWFDAVLHDRFSLHGVGYSSRYEGGRGRLLHGIESDDYISDEILLGHALMIDRQGFGRGAVRKYWLAQDFIRSIATDRIVSVEFADNNIHRQIVTWQSGAKVYVNRSTPSWSVQGKMLPEYGYYAIHGSIQSSIEEIDDVIVERSSTRDSFYVNGRGLPVTDRLEIEPRVEAIEYLGDNRLRMPIQWTCQESTAHPASVFVHFTSEKAARQDRIVFQADHTPAQLTSSWTGTLVTNAGRVIQIPQGRGSGQYDVLVGLWEAATGNRLALVGHNTPGRSILVGTLHVTEEDKRIVSVRFVPLPVKTTGNVRWNPTRQVVDFGVSQTAGAFRCVRKADHLIVTPLPDMASAKITLAIETITGSPQTVRRVESIDPNHVIRGSHPFEATANGIRFETRRTDFAYRIQF